MKVRLSFKTECLKQVSSQFRWSLAHRQDIDCLYFCLERDRKISNVYLLMLIPLKFDKIWPLNFVSIISVVAQRCLFFQHFFLVAHNL